MNADKLFDPMYTPLVYLLLIYLGAVVVIICIGECPPCRDSHISESRGEPSTNSIPRILPPDGLELTRKRARWRDSHPDDPHSDQPLPLAPLGNTMGDRKPAVSAGVPHSN
jgi:hypothetical protein